MIKQGESGKELYLGTYVDLSQHTELIVRFTSPSGQVFERGSADGVTAPLEESPLLPANGDFSGGSFVAGTYIKYIIQERDFTEPGEWKICTRYENDSVSPPEIYMGDVVLQNVGSCCGEPLEYSA